MATKSNRSTSNNGNRGRGSGRGSSNNNPEGHNQYSGWMDTAKDRPMAAAAAAAAAVGAGVFLWSRRNQISEQISHLSDQVAGWADSAMSNMSSDNSTSESSASDSRSSLGSSSSGSFNSRRNAMSGSRANRSSEPMDEIGIIEVDTVTL